MLLTPRHKDELILHYCANTLYIFLCRYVVCSWGDLKHSSVLGSDTRILKVKHIHFQTRKRQTLLSQHNRVYHRSAHEQQELIYFTCRTSKSYKALPNKNTTHTHLTIQVASHKLNSIRQIHLSDTSPAQCV